MATKEIPAFLVDEFDPYGGATKIIERNIAARHPAVLTLYSGSIPFSLALISKLAAINCWLSLIKMNAIARRYGEWNV